MTKDRYRFERGEPKLGAQLVAVGVGSVLIGSIAYLDMVLQPAVSLGLLYLIPLIMVSPWLKSGQVLVLSALCGILREQMTPEAWQGEWSARLIMVFGAFAGAAICVSELARSRRLAQARLALIEDEAGLRREAEARLRAVVDSSPLGVFALDSDGNVELANGSGLRLLGYGFDAQIRGRPLTTHLPLLADLQGGASREGFSTVLECPAKRANGEQFWAYVWLSSYGPKERRQLAVVVWDGSEIFRDREGSGWELLLTGSRLTMAAVAHEMKNLTVAALRCEERVKKVSGPEVEPELAALRTSLTAIQEVAKGALAQARPGQMRRSCQLEGVIEETSILISPLLEEHGITLVKEFPPGPLPRVRADRRALVQVFVNLAENSARVLEGRPERVIRWTLEHDTQMVRMRFYDTGPGVQNPETLFQPFQSKAQQTGLGLAISRVMLRSFDGDLRYEKTGTRPCFVMVLMREIKDGSTTAGGEQEEPAETPGRG